jgi:hypothetical protein
LRAEGKLKKFYFFLELIVFGSEFIYFSENLFIFLRKYFIFLAEIGSHSVKHRKPTIKKALTSCNQVKTGPSFIKQQHLKIPIMKL